MREAKEEGRVVWADGKAMEAMEDSEGIWWDLVEGRETEAESRFVCLRVGVQAREKSWEKKEGGKTDIKRRQDRQAEKARQAEKVRQTGKEGKTDRQRRQDRQAEN